MIVDVHTHLSTRQQWGRQVAEALEGGKAGHGDLDVHTTPQRHWSGMQPVDRAIVFGFKSIALGMQASNDDVAEYANAHPDKLIGFMSVDPNDPAALDEIDRCVGELGLKGIKMSPVYQHYDPRGDKAARVHQRAEQLGLVILTHAAFLSISTSPMKWANPLLYDPVARDFPDLKIILAHIGLPWYTDAMVVIRKHENVYADICGGVVLRPWWGYQALATCYENSVMHKLLFGSDFPLCTAEQTMQAMRSVNRFADGTNMPRIPEDELEAIINRNSLSLLGLE